MSNLKFRVWETFPNGRMRYADDMEDRDRGFLLAVGLNGKPIVVSGFQKIGGMGCYFGVGHNRILMQSTGFFDINGREMYEGDIIKIEMDYDAPQGIRIANAGRIGVIVRDDDSPSFIIHGNFLYQEIRLHNYTTFEVLGNIYENKEILKDGIPYFA